MTNSNKRRKSARLAAKEELRIAEEGRLSRPPLFSIGLIADIQHAPIPDGHSFSGTPRYYRHALEVARVAAETFEEEKVELCINLGDIIDGKCTTEATYDNSKSIGVPPGVKSMQDVVDALSSYKNGPIIHTYGNHELYNVGRFEMSNLLNIPFVKEPCGSEVGYYSFVKKQIRFIVIDSYDITLAQRCPDTSKYKKAHEILLKNNHNYAKDEASLNSPEGMIGVAKRFVAFNGAVDTIQLEWLKKTLDTAKLNGEKAIILSHQPIHPKSTSPITLIWNYSDVLDILRQYPCTVIGSFSGHAHRGGYHRDSKSGIHFRVVEAALESPAPIETFGIIDVHEDRLELRGYGECESAIFDFNHMKLENAIISYVSGSDDGK